MNNCYILYNPISGNGGGEAVAKELASKLGDSVIATEDVTKIENMAEFIAGKTEDLVICGGDGTICRFINDVDPDAIENQVYYYPSGSGNDFLRDIEVKVEDCPVNITKYIKNLPVCRVNGKDLRFINGVGFGIDGYCCQVGDEQRAKGVKDINYTTIAIKGLLFHYKPTAATVTVDGEEHRFKKVWIAPTMNGRYYGGGMMPAPDQDRLAEDRRVSAFVFHSSGKLKTLIAFPNLFKGILARDRKDIAALYSGKRVKVAFDAPRPLQVDGETILGVTEYEVFCK